MHTNAVIVLKPSPAKWAGVGLTCLLFVLIGCWMISAGKSTGWASVLFFGLGCAVAVAAMLPKATYLRITPDGFTMCSMYRAHTFRWEDVTGFAVGRVFINKMVMFNFTPAYQRSPRLRSLNAGLVGYEAGLPDNYGLSHEALADLLNKFKASSRGA